MKRLHIVPITAGFLLLTGCYTTLMRVDPAPQPRETVEWVVDSTTGDTVKVIKQVDTIVTQDRQTCVWERDLLGYPHLRCYNSYYPHDWFYYNYSPWWYRNDPYWYDYTRCPRYYYYDPSCGRCRYSADGSYRTRSRGSYYHDEGGTGSGASGASYRSRTHGIPDPKTAGPANRTGSAPVTGNSPTASGGTGKAQGEIVVPSGEGKSVIVRERRGSVPEAGTAAPVQHTAPSPGATAGTAPAPAPSSGPATAAPAAKSSQQQTAPHQAQENPRHRNPRSR